MPENTTTRLAQWIVRNRLGTFVFLVPFWTVAYRLVGDYGFHYVFSWTPGTWAHAFRFGLIAAVVYTFWPFGRRTASPEPGN